ncbi:GTP-binding protein [Buchnera aphidicola (Diuraphis noxia)]|uniref:Probable GTP-binding protein EngB n=1 Tax=Buchnera aphidicola subsp. Diuraphis noxia TaxID=118101 RepID=A0A1B2H8S6_BUCDN|nr:GTP-binding protein [Buchnera aphidicola (Diuraphis noxia)]
MHLLNYHKTKFLKSYSKTNDIEIQDGIEIGFFGYSNSGKSSVINSLTNQKKLARFSKIPGRTQLINVFEVVSGFRIVDLPGYGYSEVPLFLKNKIKKMIYNYLEKRTQLKCLVLLMDIRHPFKVLDQDIINIAIYNKIFVLVLLNKCDKFKKNQQRIQLCKVYKKLHVLLKKSFQVQLFSSLKKIGIKELKLNLNTFYQKHIIIKNSIFSKNSIKKFE